MCRVLPVVIAAAEILLQPDVGHDEKVAAPHLGQLEFCNAGSPVSPGDRNRCPRKAPNDGLQGKFDRQVEVRREEWPATVNDFAPVRLEGVGGVVQLDAEHDADDAVCYPVDDTLQWRIVDDAAAFYEA